MLSPAGFLSGLISPESFTGGPFYRGDYMDVYFVNFVKRLNSTGQAPITAQTPKFVCQLKGPTSILKPVLEISGYNLSQIGTFTRCNYAYIPDFHRYYWVHNWHFVNAKIVADLEVDVLGTYKADIEHSTQYVLRAYSLYDGEIADTKYPVKAELPTINVGYFNYNPLLPPPNGDGVVVVGIVNKSGSVTGCVSYYVMGIYAFSELCSQLFNLPTQWGAGGQDIADGIKKAITDPFQYFVSAIWLPYTVTDFTSRSLATQTNAVFVGYDTVTLSNYAYVFADKMEIAFTNLLTMPVPRHPQATARGNYMNYSPFTRYYFSFYPFTAFCEIDGAAIGGADYLYAVYTIDLRTGKGVCSLCKDYAGSSYVDWQPSQIVRSFEGQAGVNIPIAAIHTALPTSLGQFATNAAVAATSQPGGFEQFGKRLLATSTGFFAWLGGAREESTQAAYDMIGAQPFGMGDVSKIAQGAFAMKSTAEIIGSQGTMSFNYRMPVAFWAETVDAVDDAPALNGRPLCQYRPLVDPAEVLTPLTGFVCCDNPKITAPSGSFPPEVAEIENYLTSGVFLE